MLLLTAIIAAVIALDQLTKWLIVTHIGLGESVDLIHGVIRFTYIRNEGAAFGMLANQRWVFMVLSTVAILGLLVYLYFKRKESRWFTVPLALIVGGGIGNMIDRFVLKYVIDFVDFYLFPAVWGWIFNLADACVVVGAFMLGFYLIIMLVKESRKAKVPEPVVAETSPEGSGPETDLPEPANEEPEDGIPDAESGSEEPEEKTPETDDGSETGPEDPETDDHARD